MSSELEPEGITLVRRMLRGEAEAFEDFFEAHFAGLYRFALARLGGDEDAAEEVVQATLCRVVRKLHTYRGEAALFTWLCAFCRNEISSFHRRHGRRAKEVDLREEIPEIRAALETLAGGDRGGPEERLRRKEVARLVQVTLDHLPSRYGDALEWKYIYGLSIKEIAARLKIGPKAAESVLVRARRAFRGGFAALGGELVGACPRPVRGPKQVQP